MLVSVILFYFSLFNIFNPLKRGIQTHNIIQPIPSVLWAQECILICAWTISKDDAHALLIPLEYNLLLLKYHGIS